MPVSDFWRYVVDTLTQGGRIDYLICDEAQFYSRDQVDQPRQRSPSTSSSWMCSRSGSSPDQLFGAVRGWSRTADRVHVLQVEAPVLVRRATHNARTENGVMVVEGVIVVGDVEPDGPPV